MKQEAQVTENTRKQTKVGIYVQVLWKNNCRLLCIWLANEG